MRKISPSSLSKFGIEEQQFQATFNNYLQHPPATPLIVRNTNIKERGLARSWSVPGFRFEVRDARLPRFPHKNTPAFSWFRHSPFPRTKICDEGKCVGGKILRKNKKTLSVAFSLFVIDHCQIINDYDYLWLLALHCLSGHCCFLIDK